MYSFGKESSEMVAWCGLGRVAAWWLLQVGFLHLGAFGTDHGTMRHVKKKHQERSVSSTPMMRSILHRATLARTLERSVEVSSAALMRSIPQQAAAAHTVELEHSGEVGVTPPGMMRSVLTHAALDRAALTTAYSQVPSVSIATTRGVMPETATTAAAPPAVATTAAAEAIATTVPSETALAAPGQVAGNSWFGYICIGVVLMIVGYAISMRPTLWRMTAESRRMTAGVAETSRMAESHGIAQIAEAKQQAAETVERKERLLRGREGKQHTDSEDDDVARPVTSKPSLPQSNAMTATPSTASTSRYKQKIDQKGQSALP